MKSDWRKNLDVVTNVALIVCCVLFLVFLAKSYWFPVNKDASTNRAATLVGKQISVAPIDWTKNQQTLLVVLQKGCRFCEESAPFYRRLVEELSHQTKTNVVAVLPQTQSEGTEYLKERMIEIPNVVQVSPRDIGVSGTPTLLLVDNAGIVLEQWVGKLPNEATENSVIERLAQ